MNKWRVGVLGLCLALSAAVRAETIQVAVASNFTAAMKDIAAAFEQKTGNEVHLAFGSSGKFYAQIRHGAPFQVFLSADQAKPRALDRAGLGVAASRFTYALGALVLWSAKPHAVSDGAALLKAGRFNKLALANPKLAPYGAAAVEVLQHLRVKKATQKKWVRGENIAQTYQFVSTGNAAIGFVALSQVLRHGTMARGSGWIVPRRLYSPIRQDAVLLKAGQQSAAARALLAFLRGKQAAAIMASYGYRAP